jgi:hypothetical protein
MVKVRRQCSQRAKPGSSPAGSKIARTYLFLGVLPRLGGGRRSPEVAPQPLTVDASRQQDGGSDEEQRARKHRYTPVGSTRRPLAFTELPVPRVRRDAVRWDRLRRRGEHSKRDNDGESEEQWNEQDSHPPSVAPFYGVRAAPI